MVVGMSWHDQYCDEKECQKGGEWGEVFGHDVCLLL